MFQKNVEKHCLDEIGKFEIDLDVLNERKLQYFPMREG